MCSCWLYNIARGIDNEPVTNRLVCKSIGSSKNFPGKQAIVKLEVVRVRPINEKKNIEIVFFINFYIFSSKIG